MADKAALMAEAYKRGLLPPERATLYEVALKRGLVHAEPAVHALADARASLAGQSTSSRAMSAGLDEATLHGSRHLEALGGTAGNMIGGGIRALTGHPQNYSPADYMGAMEQALRERDAQFGKEHPVINAASRIGGAVATPAGVAGKFIRGAEIASKAPAAAKALALGGRVARSAVVGGGVGAVSGALGADSLDNAPGEALKGAKVGAVVGGVAEPVMAAGEAGLRGVKAGLSALRPKSPPDLEALSRIKDAAYRKVDDAGVQFHSGAVKDLVNGIEDEMKAASISKLRHPKAYSMLAELKSQKGPLSLPAIDQIRQGYSPRCRGLIGSVRTVLRQQNDPQYRRVARRGGAGSSDGRRSAIRCQDAVHCPRRTWSRA